MGLESHLRVVSFYDLYLFKQNRKKYVADNESEQPQCQSDTRYMCSIHNDTPFCMCVSGMGLREDGRVSLNFGNPMKVGDPQSPFSFVKQGPRDENRDPLVCVLK